MFYSQTLHKVLFFFKDLYQVDYFKKYKNLCTNIQEVGWMWGEVVVVMVVNIILSNFFIGGKGQKMRIMGMWVGNKELLSTHYNFSC